MENKGADQLRSYCAADLRLCFFFAYAKKNRYSHGVTPLVLDSIVSQTRGESIFYALCKRKERQT